jgi:cytochrome c-type biogenesis protein CcmF
MFGSILVKVALVSTLVSCLAYYTTHRTHTTQYLSLARLAYSTAVALVLSFCALMIYFILTHQFQYTYVWNYSSTDLPTPLLISTFYAGQEGSFSLWALFTAIIGVFLLSYTSKRNYEAETMLIWNMILLFLLLMLVVKNPFEMVWETFPKELVHSGMLPAGLTNVVWLDEAKRIWAQYPVEGKGLNPLLQNYWMVIHPPILFSGFTAMAVPFTFALAGLLRRDYQNWIVVAKPWTVFGAAALGTGIILGGYWAYETLGWGGYWGWDPVENSSLIPWLVCIASVHTMMAQRRSGTFVRTNFVLSILCFIMVLYSTFLTRSGVLGDTSVHSFVDPGMWAYWLLLGFLISFMVFGFGLLLKRMREMPKIPVEHSIYSREFALFLGAFTICFAAVFITLGTSSPIITTIVKGRAAAVDIAYYVKTTLPLGIVIAFLTGVGQLLWWKTSKAKELFQNVRYPLLSTVLFTIGLIIVGVHDVPILIFSACSAFALFVNIFVGYKIFKGNPRFAGGAIAHIGLALLFLGFVSSSRYDEKQTLSLEQGKPVVALDGYTLTYRGNYPVDNERYGFQVEVSKDNEVFLMMPVMHFSSFNNSTLRHPDVRNLYTKDLYISPLSVETPDEQRTKTLSLQKDETKEFNGMKIKFVDFDFPDEEKGKMVTGEAEVTIGVMLEVEKDGKKEEVKPLFKRSAAGPTFVPATLKGTQIEFSIVRMQPNREDKSKSSVEISVNDPTLTPATKAETLVVEASIKPYINLVWMGTITLVVGFVLTIYRRVQEARGKREYASHHPVGC